MASEKNLYYLIVGINDYLDKPLKGCVNDAEKMDAYLQSLKSERVFASIYPKKLLNEQATKQEVIAGIQNHLGQAKDDDVAFFYYSGHGANEDAGDLFKDERDGFLECMVCYYEKDQTAGFLLADKELRYLFSNIKTNPHLVTVFDACHSGDMTRDVDSENQVILKRLTKSFKARPHEEFLFTTEIGIDRLKNEDLSDLIPNKNHVHISACLSDESSWEKNGSGVFTNYLLQLLEGTRNQINYQDIARYARLSLRNMTQTQQTPTINTLGQGPTNHLSSWLNMQGEQDEKNSGMLLYHEKDGWIYTFGKLMGIQNGMDLSIFKGDEQLKSRITNSFLTYSKIEQLPEMGDWDINGKYEAFTPTIHTPLELYLNGEFTGGTAVSEADHQKTLESVRTIIGSRENVDLVDIQQAGFFLNVVDNFVYFSKKGDPLRPIARQYNTLQPQVELEQFLKDQLKFLIKWNHFNTLENPAHPFENRHAPDGSGPIEVTFHLEGEMGKEQENQKMSKIITGELIEFPALEKRHPAKGYFYNRYRLMMKNTSQRVLYIGVLRLGSDLSIDCYCNEEVVKLEPGKLMELYPTNPDKTIRRASFYDYQEQYNWRFEEIIFKFIVNTSDFTTTFKDFSQPHVELPFLPESPENERDAGLNVLRSGGTMRLRPMLWDVYSCTLRLKNPEFQPA